MSSSTGWELPPAEAMPMAVPLPDTGAGSSFAPVTINDTHNKSANGFGEPGNERGEPVKDSLPNSTNGHGPRFDVEASKKTKAAGWGGTPGEVNESSSLNPDKQAEALQPGWAHNTARYEYLEEYGDVAPRFPELEEQLYNSDLINRAGVKLDRLMTVKVDAESVNRVQPIEDFATAGLHPVLLENIQLCLYERPTPIQAYVIPAVNQGFDVIGVAQTGSGKTAAFMIPCINKLMGKVKKLAAPRPNLAAGFNMTADGVRAEPLILIVAPTRELCCQIYDEARRLCYRSMLRPCVAYGGAPVKEQLAQLARGCDILVATPGRLIDIMSRGDRLSLRRVRFTIIDEADEMMHGDWEEEMSKIMGGGDMNEDGDHRYLLFSATFPRRLKALAETHLSPDHVHISIGRTGSIHAAVRQNVVWVESNAKMQALYDLLLSIPPGRTMVFVRSKKQADLVDDYLYNMGFPSTAIHSDRTQLEREDAMRSFKNGKSPILVATGVSARGLDVRNVMHVINFDLPSADYDGKTEYVHRIGRTARIGNEGLATSFNNEKDVAMAPFLTKVLLECNQTIPQFFEEFVPPDGIINWDEEEEEVAAIFNDGIDDNALGAGADAGADAWGSGGNVTSAPAASTTEEHWGGDNAANNSAW